MYWERTVDDVGMWGKEGIDVAADSGTLIGSSLAKKILVAVEWGSQIWMLRSGWPKQTN